MEYRLLGNSGCAVSSLALGTMTFGAESSEEIAREQLDVFMAAGGTLIDTADVYSSGVSEQIVGRWLADPPPGIKDQGGLATKGRFPVGGRTERPRPHPPTPAAGHRRLAAATRRRLRRPLPGAQLGSADPDRRNPPHPRRVRSAGQDPLHRAVQLHRLAGAEGRGDRSRPWTGGP